MSNACSAAILFAGCFVMGCGPSPSGPAMPTFDVEAISGRALLEYDKDSSGDLSMDELKASPALLEALPRLDKDGNQRLSQSELSNHFQEYQTAMTSLFPWSCQVISNGRPVVGATVTLTPEPFMGDAVSKAVGTTDAQGQASPAVNDADLKGVQVGMYRIEISKTDASGKELIPDQYNRHTTLGQELASGVRTAETTRIIQIVE